MNKKSKMKIKIGKFTQKIYRQVGERTPDLGPGSIGWKYYGGKW